MNEITYIYTTNQIKTIVSGKVFNEFELLILKLLDNKSFKSDKLKKLLIRINSIYKLSKNKSDIQSQNKYLNYRLKALNTLVEKVGLSDEDYQILVLNSIPDERLESNLKLCDKNILYKDLIKKTFDIAIKDPNINLNFYVYKYKNLFDSVEDCYNEVLYILYKASAGYVINNVGSKGVFFYYHFSLYIRGYIKLIINERIDQSNIISYEDFLEEAEDFYTEEYL